MDAVDVLHELFVALSPGGLQALAASVVRRDRQVQFRAYGLDPEVVAEVVDHRVGLVRGWSSSFVGPTQLGNFPAELAQFGPLDSGQ
ncbi:hypothetical protein [Actinacidiphila reveromycinica]|uniref:hypothetical protein n=1 Tax=Actinacidiphila reveromycinica TaxID=659352 RepID=UPI001F3EE7E5|nr:hypothetical protein [Streptomyces sp. SN-593]